MRILAVDPGEKNIGLAISDPTATIANPLAIITHQSRAIDAGQIAQVAGEYQVSRIIVGQALGADNQPTPQSRRAARLMRAIKSQTEIPVELWDESGSTQAAQSARRSLGLKRARRGGHLDDLAATWILQSYLDARQPKPFFPSGTNHNLKP